MHTYIPRDGTAAVASLTTRRFTARLARGVDRYLYRLALLSCTLRLWMSP
jgi:hypothetical protein